MKNADQLQRIFFCSGARNQRLLNEFTTSNVSMEIDERIASFKALGFSKSKNDIGAVCTTSGTAVAECLPAMIEAFYSDTKLLLISADRPFKLSGSGAPQTIEHEIVTRGFRRDYRDLEFDEFCKLDLRELQYPAHVNVRITTKDETGSFLKEKSFTNFSTFMSSIKNPIFLFSHENSSLRPLVEKFLLTGIPFYAEVASGAKDLSPIKTEKKLLELFHQGAFDGVVRIGHTPLSKFWRILEGKKLPVYSFDSRGLKALSYGNVEKSSACDLINEKRFWEVLPRATTIFTDDSIQDLFALCNKYPSSEISFVKSIHDILPLDSKVFLGNSLPIRYFELIQDKKFQIMANRGVNGIDGQLATAIGWAQSSSDIIYCILGDMTFSYDLTSLLSFPSNLKCIVINNSGGRIFETLGMDSRLIMEHGRNFKNICNGFGLKYGDSLRDLGLSQIIELTPDLEQTRQFHGEWRV